MASTYPAELSTVSMALELLEVDTDPRIQSAVSRTSERIVPLTAPLDYVTIDWDALEASMRSAEDQRKLRMANELLEGPDVEQGLFHFDNGTYYILGIIEDGNFRQKLLRTDEPPS
jgi:hypothetical protein